MFRLHVVLDQSKDWMEYVPPWLTALAAFLTVVVAFRIALNQNRLQKALAEEQIKIQRMQFEQPGRQLKKDLFDLNTDKHKDDPTLVENYRLKAGRILLRLKVASRLKPPEGARLQSRLKAWWAL